MSMSEIESNSNPFENQRKAVGNELRPLPNPAQLEQVSIWRGAQGVSRTQQQGDSFAPGRDSFWFSSPRLSSSQLHLFYLLLHQACFSPPCHMEERNKCSLCCQTYRCRQAKCQWKMLCSEEVQSRQLCKVLGSGHRASAWGLLYIGGRETLIKTRSVKFFKWCFLYRFHMGSIFAQTSDRSGLWSHTYTWRGQMLLGNLWWLGGLCQMPEWQGDNWKLAGSLKLWMSLPGGFLLLLLLLLFPKG